MTREELLQSTIDYYSVDPVKRRCTRSSGGCYYSPEKADKAGLTEGCAIGRLLSPELKVTLDNLEETSIDSIMRNPEILSLLPDWMRIMSGNFLSRVQRLHDDKDNWDNEGLSARGEMSVKDIIALYGLNPANIKI